MTSYNIKINLSRKERELFMKYAKEKNISLDKFISEVVNEAIEDEYDARIGDEAYEEYLASGCKSYSLEEVLEKYGL